MKHLGLFEGIMGFGLAAQWMGWETTVWCEWDKKCQELLKRKIPGAIGHGNIKETDFKTYANKIDILTGGFPCQPFSTSGKRKGTDDDRYLWPEMLRSVREVQPPWIVGENVPGLINWSRGLVFEQICSDLENEGYKILPVILPACSVNAPHRRDRIWFIAYSANARSKNMQSRGENSIYGSEFTANPNEFNGDLSGHGTSKVSQFKTSRVLENLASYPDLSSTVNTISAGRDMLTSSFSDSTCGTSEGEIRMEKSKGPVQGSWDYFPTQSPVCGGNDGIPGRLDRLKQLGNAIVPQVAYQIFKAIEQYESLIPLTNPTNR